MLGGIAVAYVLSARDDDEGTRTVAETSRVPAVVGTPVGEAVQLLRREGFPSRIVRRVTENRPPDTVLEQSPLAGREVSRGRTVTLTVARDRLTVDVPNVKGLLVGLAMRRLAAAELRSAATQVFSTSPKGQVVSQAPAAGAEARKGSIVRLTVSKGREQVAVPSLVGDLREEALAKLSALALKATVVEVPAQNIDNTVIAQRPVPGIRVPKGSAVRINVATSTSTPPPVTPPTPPPATTTPTQTTVPDTVGMRVGEAIARVEGAGLRADTYPVPSQEPRGTVVSQSPAAGTTVNRGSGVRLNVSLGPQPRPVRAVPDVTGQDEVSARTQLRAAGFNVRTLDRETTDPAQEGIVIEQEPPGGTRVPFGTQVVIFVGRLTP